MPDSLYILVPGTTANERFSSAIQTTVFLQAPIVSDEAVWAYEHPDGMGRTAQFRKVSAESANDWARSEMEEVQLDPGWELPQSYLTTLLADTHYPFEVLLRPRPWTHSDTVELLSGLIDEKIWLRWDTETGTAMQLERVIALIKTGKLEWAFSVAEA